MGFVVKAVKSVVKAVVGVVSKVIGGVVGFLVGGKSSKKAKSANNLNKQLEPEAYRKIIFGKTAAPLDVRFWEVYGSSGTLYDEVLAVACHRVNAFKELYFESDLAFDTNGTVQSKYNGVVSRAVKLGAPAQTALSVGSGTQWTSAATFDGCAHMVLKWVPNEKKLPNGIPNRYTQVVEGAYVYDPRRDSTVAGGSGPHRINDQSTWAYATLDGNSQPIGRNNALQALWYLLGWRVQNPVTGEWVLVAGRGVDPQDINLATFIAGANNCEIAGYYTDMILSTEDDHVSNEEKITVNGLIGRLIDPGGLWSYYANVDDTANIAVELTDADIIEGVNVTWNEYKGMNEQYNQVRGKFIYPAAPVLYQAFPYPMVRDTTYENNLGVKRAKPQDFEQVLDSTLAQRLARLLLNQGQYQGEFSAGFNYRMLKAQAWSVVRYTSERYGWVKLFRVWRHDISTDAGVGALLKEIHPSIWGAGTVTAPLAPGLGALYDPAQEIAATGVNVALHPVVGANGDKGDGFRIYWNTPPNNVRRTEIRYRLVGTAYWETAGPVARDVTQVIIAPLLSGAIYEAAIRHISIHEVPGPWVTPLANPFQLGTTGTVNAAAIAAAGGTANWSQIIDDNGHRPDNDADVTLANVSAGIVGQASTATSSDFAVITGATRPSDNAGTTLRFIVAAGSAAMTIQGNTIQRNGGATAWNCFAYSSEVQVGSCVISARMANIGSIFGLTVNTTILAGSETETFELIQWGWHRSSNGFWYIITNGGFNINLGTTFNGVVFSSTTLFTIVANGRSVKFYADGVLIHTISNLSQLNFVWRAGICFAENVGKITDVIFNSADAASMFRDDGITVMPQAEVRTSEGISSGYINQSAWGTYTGLVPTNVAGQVQYLDTSGNLGGINRITDRRLTLIRRADGVTDVTEGAVVTNLGISSGFTGQSSWATYTGRTPADVSTRLNYSQSDGSFRLGTGNGILSEAADFWITNSNAVTSFGIASGIASQGYLATQNYADWSTRVTGVGRPANNAGTTLSIYDKHGSTYTITGNSIQKTVGVASNWDYNVYSNDAYFGACFASFRFDTVATFAGISSTNPDANYGAFDYSWHRSENGKWYIFELGAGNDYGTSSNGVNFSTNTLFSIIYDGFTVKYYADGVLIRTVNTTANRMFYFGAACYYPSNLIQISNVLFGPGANIRTYRDDGSTVMPQAEIRTSEGVSSGYTGQTAWGTYSGSTNRVSRINDSGRVSDPTLYNTQLIMGPSNVTNLAPSYTVGGSNVTVNLPAHNRVIAGPEGPVTLSYGAMSATWPFSSYWTAYVDDPNLAGIGSPTVTLTSNPNDLLYPGRYQVSSGVTPDSNGTGGGTGGGGGGGGGWGGCVAVESRMPNGKCALHIEAGDELLSLDYLNYDMPTMVKCTGNVLKQGDCAEIESESGIKLVLALDTPCTLYGGECVSVSELLGRKLAVQDADGFRWETIVRIEGVGVLPIAHISASEGTYAAGKEPGKFIFTHNAMQKP